MSEHAGSIEESSTHGPTTAALPAFNEGLQLHDVRSFPKSHVQSGDMCSVTSDPTDQSPHHAPAMRGYVISTTAKYDICSRPEIQADFYIDRCMSPKSVLMDNSLESSIRASISEINRIPALALQLVPLIILRVVIIIFDPTTVTKLPYPSSHG